MQAEEEMIVTGYDTLSGLFQGDGIAQLILDGQGKGGLLHGDGLYIGDGGIGWVEPQPASRVRDMTIARSRASILFIILFSFFLLAGPQGMRSHPFIFFKNNQ